MTKEILSKAAGNPVLWHLFLAELAGAMQCDSGFLSIADIGRDGELLGQFIVTGILNIAPTGSHRHFVQIRVALVIARTKRGQSTKRGQVLQRHTKGYFLNHTL